MNVEEMTSKIGCKVGMLPTTFLGLPLGAAHNSVVAWDGVEERFQKRLEMRKRQYISKWRRLTLVKSMLTSLPIYLMSLFRMSRRVCLRLEKIKRDFLWGGGSLESKPCLVKWAIVCLDKRKWGLGVRRLHSLNKALICKWIWRFAIWKWMSFGEKLFVVNIENWKEDGALRKWRADMAWGYGRL